MYGIIYKAINKINGKLYIGQTTNSLEKRKSSHKSKAKCGSTDCRHFWNALRKYGFDSFGWEVICDIEAPTDILLEYLKITEDMWIEQFDARNRKIGYNIREASSRGEHSEESKKKMSEAQKGKLIGERNPMYGVHRFGEKNPMYGRTGEKAPMYGKHHSEKTKRKLSEAKKGEKHPMYGKHRSEETKKKLRRK